ncbi:transcription factor [Fusarium globosum]|uniref:Transcription factor n=1 Tax=Fusarium globosum TaxID=78864 RepID=A0A8H5XYH1_9HYPO|nr:transcription factor [Fusarium globosum]
MYLSDGLTRVSSRKHLRLSNSPILPRYPTLFLITSSTLPIVARHPRSSLVIRRVPDKQPVSYAAAQRSNATGNLTRNDAGDAYSLTASVSASQKNPEDDRILNHLQELLSNANTPEHATTRGYSVSGDGDEDAYSEEEEEQDPVAMPDFIQRTQQSLAIDDAENPLQLLARASYIQPSPESRHGNSPIQAHTASTQGQTEDEIQAFFAPAQVHLDVGPDVDPVSLGLVSEEEADKLFNLSVEIVLAFMVNIPWMFPGQHSTDDETCTYISIANTVATDLSLHKSLISPEMVGSGSGIGLARGDCLDPRAALAMDGFPEIDPWSEKGRLFLRNRERCWLSLFVLERGMSLARGRPFSVPMTRSLKDCDNWHRSEYADPLDGHLVSMAVLRRDLDALFATVRALCDGSQMASSDGSLIAQSIQGSIERFFDQWYTEWGVSIGKGPDRRLPPYVEILVTHTRLSIYGGVINHPTAPLEVRRFFHTAGLSSALNVMRAAIQGESQLQSMPNNTAIMISFAACFALTLSSYATGGSALAPSVRNLIDETATVLERIGKVTRHRNGLSIKYGKYLKQIVRRAATGDGISDPRMPIVNEAPITTPTFLDQQALWPEPLQFSAMSDDQIVQALNQPGNDFEPSFGGLSWEDMTNFEWLYWPEVGI